MAQITQYNKLAEITRIIPKWKYAVFKIFSRFRIFEQLALALKNRDCPEIFHCIEYLNIFFAIQDFWVTLRLLWKRVALKIFTALNIYSLSFRIFEKLALARKTEFALIFLALLNIAYFLDSGLLSNLRLSWKFPSQGAAALPDPPPRTPMHEAIDIGNFVGRSLSERDRRTLLLNSWTPLSSYEFLVAHTGFQKRRFQMQWLEDFK